LGFVLQTATQHYDECTNATTITVFAFFVGSLCAATTPSSIPPSKQQARKDEKYLFDKYHFFMSGFVYREYLLAPQHRSHFVSLLVF
jgi:hypothetical protein